MHIIHSMTQGTFQSGTECKSWRKGVLWIETAPRPDRLSTLGEFMKSEAARLERNFQMLYKLWAEETLVQLILVIPGVHLGDASAWDTQGLKNNVDPSVHRARLGENKCLVYCWLQYGCLLMSPQEKWPAAAVLEVHECPTCGLGGTVDLLSFWGWTGALPSHTCRLLSLSPWIWVPAEGGSAELSLVFLFFTWTMANLSSRPNLLWSRTFFLSLSLFNRFGLVFLNFFWCFLFNLFLHEIILVLTYFMLSLS